MGKRSLLCLAGEYSPNLHAGSFTPNVEVRSEKHLRGWIPPSEGMNVAPTGCNSLERVVTKSATWPWSPCSFLSHHVINSAFAFTPFCSVSPPCCDRVRTPQLTTLPCCLNHQPPESFGNYILVKTKTANKQKRQKTKQQHSTQLQQKKMEILFF